MNAESGTAPLASGPMRRLQIVVVALCIALNALDGFDVLAISFAAPGIAAEWGITRATLGIVLSMELFGMAAGSVLIGNVADRIGRRPTILACLIVMATGMFLAAATREVATLSITRLLTGLGIGGMISSTSALVAEFSNDRRRGLNVALNIAGYSTGAILGGVGASALLAATGAWRSVFVFGGIMTTVLLPIVFLLLPESIDSLLARRPQGALERVNAILAKLGRESLQALPPRSGHVAKPSIASLFAHGYSRITLLLTVAYFTQIMTFYYIQKWIPKIVVDLGFEQAEAGTVLVAANIGNLAGAIVIGLASQRFRLRPLIVTAMIAGFAAIAVFGLGFHDVAALSIVAMIAGFFVNASVVGLYPIMTQLYPAALRASGIGFVIGIGRGGSALGPIVTGALFTGGAGLLLVSVVMGAGALIAATMLLLLQQDPSAQSVQSGKLADEPGRA
jgi:benzoate transport